MTRRSGVVWVQVLDHGTVGFEFGDLTSLFEEPDLAAEGSLHVISSPPSAYIVYGAGQLGLLDVTSGSYDATWVDLERSLVADRSEIVLDGGDESFAAPCNGAVLLALWRVGR